MLHQILFVTILAHVSVAQSAVQVPAARIETVIKNVENEMTKNPIFRELERLASRHGFEIYLEKDSADSVVRVIGTGRLQTKQSLPNLDFLGANENIALVVRGSDYHLELVNSLISRYLERTNPFTGKSRWRTRLETPAEADFQHRLASLVPKVFIHCRGCYGRVDRNFVEFFLANETDARSTLDATELLIRLRELERAIAVRPTRIKPALFQATLVLLSRLNAYRLREVELVVIYDVMTSIDNIARTPNADNGAINRELETLGFEKAYREVSARILERPEFKYDIDFSEVPDSVVARAAAVLRFVKWSAVRKCQSMFESTAP